MHNTTADFIRDIYKTNSTIGLHEPTFSSLEKKNLEDVIDSTYVSSVGTYVDSFEEDIRRFTGSTKAVATSNGTAALHLSLVLAGVETNDLVLTQSLTFVATANAIRYQGADPIFIDISEVGLGLCPIAASQYLDSNCFIDDEGFCQEKSSSRKIKALIVMHTFGHPAQLNELKHLCSIWNLKLIEDSAESLGSYYMNIHTGSIGDYGAISFNGNKIITTGGGGMLLCKNHKEGIKAKHLSTTAKLRSEDFYHDAIGYNYRMPNLNAALGCAQFKQLEIFISQKRFLAQSYYNFFNSSDFDFVLEPKYARSNYWLNAILAPDLQSRNDFLKNIQNLGIMCRPAWFLMHDLPMFNTCITDDLKVTKNIWSRLINIPSTPVGIK